MKLHMFDETKLEATWGKRNERRHRRCVAHHSQILWRSAEERGEQDVYRSPRFIKRCTASALWAVLQEDKDPGCIAPHSLGQWIPAKLSGTITVCDSASTNKLLIKNLNSTVPHDEFVLSIYCLQHKSGTSVEVTTKLFDLLGQAYCIEGLFKRGDFADDLMTEVRVIFERDLPVGNMESTPPEQPGDASYARSLLEMCFVCGGNDGLWPVEDGTPI